MKRLVTVGQLVYFEKESRLLADNPLGDPAQRSLPVYLPPGYNDESSQKQRYPVVWVLAPFTSWGERFFNLQAWDENILQIIDRLTADHAIPPTIFAFPDCFTKYGGSQYRNSSAIGPYNDYLTQELLPFLDGVARTKPEAAHRALLGYSSGGYGAFMLAMEHPDKFSALASHSGDMLFEACYWPDIPGAIRAIEAAGGLASFMAEIDSLSRTREKSKDWFNAFSLIAMSAAYSPNPDSEWGFDLPFDTYTGEIDPASWQRWTSQDPLRIVPDHIETLQAMRCITFDCGSQDEYNLFLGARRMHQLLSKNKVTHTYDEFAGGHGNINWRYALSIPQIANAIR